MGKCMFGVGRGKVLNATKIDAIARAYDSRAAFVNPRLPGEGYRYWFTIPNRGEPFDSTDAREILARVEAAGGLKVLR